MLLYLFKVCVPFRPNSSFISALSVYGPLEKGEDGNRQYRAGCAPAPGAILDA